MSKWVQLTKEQASQHKLYGVGGWLIVFYVFFALNLLSGIGHSAIVVQEFYGTDVSKAGISHYAFVTTNTKIFGIQLLGWIQFALYLTVFYLALTKNHSFRRVSTVLFVGFVIVKPIILAATANFEELLSFPFYALFIGLTLIYLNLSKRVRVTYDWMVKATDEDVGALMSASVVKPIPQGERREPTF